MEILQTHAEEFLQMTLYTIVKYAVFFHFFFSSIWAIQQKKAEKNKKTGVFSVIFVVFYQSSQAGINQCKKKIKQKRRNQSEKQIKNRFKHQKSVRKKKLQKISPQKKSYIYIVANRNEQIFIGVECRNECFAEMSVLLK